MARSRQKAIPDDPHELTKLLVEYYKHLSTLSGVGIVVMLTIYREDVLQQALVFLTVVSFALAVLASLVGFLRILVRFNYPLKMQEDLVSVPFTAWAATYLFAQAIVSLLIHTALSMAMLATLGVFIVGSVILMLWILRGKLPISWRRLRHPKTEEQQGQK